MSNNTPRYLLAAAAFRIPINPFGNRFFSTVLDNIAHNFIVLLEEQANGERVAVASFHGLSTRITRDADGNEEKELLALGQFNDFLMAYCFRKPPEFPHAPPFSTEEINVLRQALEQTLNAPMRYYDINEDYEASQYEKGAWLPYESSDHVVLYGEKPQEDDALRLWNRLRMLRPYINERKLHYSAFGVGLKCLWETPTNSNSIYTLALRVMALPVHKFEHLIQPGIGNTILNETEINAFIQKCEQKEQMGHDIEPTSLLVGIDETTEIEVLTSKAG